MRRVSKSELEKPHRRRCRRRSSVFSIASSSGLAPHKPTVPIETSSDGAIYEGKRGQHCTVQLNYGTITLDQELFPHTIYHYKVIKVHPATASDAEISFALTTFMEKNFPTIVFASDGCKSVYTREKLLEKGVEIETFTRDAKILIGDLRKKFKIILKYIASVDMRILLNYREREYQNCDQPAAAMHVLSIILRSVSSRLLTTEGVTQVGRYTCFVPDDRQPKAVDGIRLYYFFHRSPVLGRSGLFLNMDVLHRAVSFPADVSKFQNRTLKSREADSRECSLRQLAAIIKGSITTTHERRAKIQRLVERAGLACDNTAVDFGIRIDVNFQSIDARILPAPRLRFASSLMTPVAGAWCRNDFWRTPQRSVSWTIVNCNARIGERKIEDFSRRLITAANSCGISLHTSVEIAFVSASKANFTIRLAETFARLKREQKDIVFVVIDETFEECYARVKQVAELDVGLLTQCVRGCTIQRLHDSTLTSLLLKVNAKLNGENLCIERCKEPRTMFVGADVTHAGGENRGFPSVAGVASSLDGAGFRYNCAWRLQPPTREMIDDLEEILCEHLQTYKRNNRGELPERIFYYRDGVSDNQFRRVLDIEMSAMRCAMRRAYGTSQPAKITFVVVQKRHHTRFFPTDAKNACGKYGNVSPGTVVDRDIVHPFQQQFLLASHTAIRGVTRPAKYCVLADESKIDPDTLQCITYDLCHLFARCSRTVSYPAPTYYAHLVAERGKNYVYGEKLDLNNLRHEQQRRMIRSEFAAKSPMFFV